MRIFKKIAAVMFAIAVLCQVMVISAAATGKVTLKGPDKLDAGVEFEVSLNAEGEGIYGINGQVTYDTDSLEYVHASSSISGTWETEINMVDDILYFASADSEYKNPISQSTEILTITFKTTDTMSADNLFVKTGDVEVSVGKKLVSLDGYEYKLPEADTADNSGEESEGDSDGETITIVTKKESMYNNNLLESLIVKNAEITPEFSPEVQKYEATVPFKTKVLEVEAKPVSPTATVEYVDTELKYVGTNIVRVRVLSESGLQRTYKIYVVREDKAKTSANVADEGIAMWIIILIIVGALLLIAAIVVSIILIMKKKKKINS